MTETMILLLGQQMSVSAAAITGRFWARGNLMEKIQNAPNAAGTIYRYETENHVTGHCLHDGHIGSLCPNRNHNNYDNNEHRNRNSHRVFARFRFRRQGSEWSRWQAINMAKR